jgi:hypothetical protein
LLQKHNQDQKDANNNVKNGQQSNQHLVFNDGCERGRIQACASDQGAINILFLH